jgi:regulator of protease activity HflC (stomatin/prohibitin superfamily)
MDRLSKTIFTFVGVTLLIAIGLILFVDRIPVRTYGVRQTIWGGAGIEARDFTTGFHVGISGFHKWHLLDASTHFLEFVAVDERQGIAGPARPHSIFPRSGGPSDLATPAYTRHAALEIRNRDGNIVTIDASVPYRIVPGAAHRIVQDGLKVTYQDRVKATVESVLREILSEMSNEAFQEMDKRLATSAKALEALNRKLEQFHVKAESVLVRRVAFQTDYEAKLQQKQLLTQKANLDQAETLRFQEVLKTGTIEKEIAAAEAQSKAQWEKRMETLRAEYTLQIAQIQGEALQYSKRTKSEAEATYQTRIAAGKLAKDQAEALSNQLRSEALATAGGQIYVARLAAQNLKLGKVVLNSTDPRVPLLLDVHKLAELFIGVAPPPTITSQNP